MTEADAVGLYICGTTLCRAAVRRTGRLVAVALAEEPLPSASVAPTGNGAALAPNGGLNRNGPAVCVACLPGHAVLSRHWSFPRANPQVLRRMIAHRLEADLPIRPDALAWGFRRARRAASDGGLPVLVQAARAEHVDECLQRLAGAGVHPHVLTTETEALGGLYRHGIRRLTDQGPEALVLVLGDVWLVATFADEAAHAVRRVNVEPDRLEAACRECRQLIESPAGRERLRRVWWCGLAEPPPMLAELLGAPVEPAEPAENLVDGEGRHLARERLATHGPAIGLALAGLLEPGEMIRLAGRELAPETPPSRLEWLLARPKLLGGVAAAALLLAGLLHVAALWSEVGKMRGALAEAARAPAASADHAAKVRALQQVQTYRIDVEAVFAALCEPVPDSIVISSVLLGRDGRMTVKGTAKDPKAVFTLADALRKSPRFANVSPERTEPGQGGAFAIRLDLAGVAPLASSTRGGAAWR